MRYRVHHVTSYEYSDSVSICHNEARLVPRATPHQRPLGTRLSIDPLLQNCNNNVLNPTVAFNPTPAFALANGIDLTASGSYRF